MSNDQQERHTRFKNRLDSLPLTPGVYIMRDAGGAIIYVGKAVNLRNRVRSYFGSLSGAAPKVGRMVQHIADFEYILTDTELEALILENQLIKKHKPHYNVRLKDDKTYPYIRVTVQEEWPRVTYTRRLAEDGSRYFGPYANAGAAQTTLDLLNRLFPYRTCDLVIDGKMPRPCLQYYMHRCLAPCAGLADKAAYMDAIKGVMLFLGGKQDAILRDLQKRMDAASETLEFERAAYIRDQIRAIEKTSEQQKVFTATPTDEDVIAFARNDGDACVQVFFIRDGKLLGSERYVLENTSGAEPGEVLGSFVTQFYEDSTDIPPNLVLQHDLDEAAILESWLRQKRGDTVRLSVPRTGEKRDLVELVARNATECVEEMRRRWLTDEQKGTAALTDLQAALGLAAWPQRIECYDISHSGGTNTVASMVVFERGLAAKKEYRRFEIKTATNNDFLSMQEVLRRRFRRAGQERATQAAQETPTGWAVLPDLIVIDGGKGQLSAAVEVMAEVNLSDIPIIGLAKQQEEVFAPGKSLGIMLPREGEALHLLQRIRDEAHRFAIGYHRKLRSTRAFKGKLDEIPGIGPKRKTALLKQFGSLKKMREASIEDLAAVPGMDRRAAEKLKELL
ncbi:MAG: excinuclease ABC subunit UvrC [Chloroflexia bacterium]